MTFTSIEVLSLCSIVANICIISKTFASEITNRLTQRNGQVVPSTFFYIGAQPEDGGNYPHHSPLFKMNEKSILIAAKAVATVTINYLFFNKKM